ncbi:transmembrane protein [Citrus sinensis]|uniref:Transmembrane protein n=1 Tax=Citrus sinensis TaxID=2711 RepID=A0ACB8MAK3_CITSI|nr:transmembrane protein [Citrus sinensis]
MEMEEDKITIASIKKCKEDRIYVGEKLEPQRGCCIYRVPKGLRKINKEAYTPKTWQKLIHFVDLYEQTIRNCYEDTSCTFKLKKFDFITMILYDAVFIIELFLRSCFGPIDFLLVTPRLTLISYDLQLLENQLPFFVLNELYRLAFPNPEISYPSFFDLSCNFFFPNKQLSEIGVGIEEVKHFTDLRRHFMTKKLYQFQEPTGSRGTVTDVPCAVKLNESGVKFKCNEGECSLDVSFKKVKKLCLGVHDELQIPKIEVYDETELLFRNVMALEQCHYPFETHVCHFIDLMDLLVNTKEDVDLLVEKKIISNNVGDSATITRMFNRLCLQTTLSPYSRYYAVSEEIKKYYGNRWNHTKATLKSVYFSNLWRGTGTIAAFLLVLLTLIQTVCSILQFL